MRFKTLSKRSRGTADTLMALATLEEFFTKLSTVFVSMNSLNQKAYHILITFSFVFSFLFLYSLLYSLFFLVPFSADRGTSWAVLKFGSAAVCLVAPRMLSMSAWFPNADHLVPCCCTHCTHLHPDLSIFFLLGTWHWVHQWWTMVSGLKPSLLGDCCHRPMTSKRSRINFRILHLQKLNSALKILEENSSFFFHFRNGRSWDQTWRDVAQRSTPWAAGRVLRGFVRCERCKFHCTEKRRSLEQKNFTKLRSYSWNL